MTPNKSDSGELRTQLESLFRRDFPGNSDQWYIDQAERFRIPLTAHIQAVGERVIGADLIDYGGSGYEHVSMVNIEKDNERQRLAQYLGDK